MTPPIQDALGRMVDVRCATRIVSLVPSETESVAELASLSLIVGRTDYCELPAGVEAIPSVGGTKDFDVEAVLALSPDLILANQEENGRKRVEALIDAGAPVHVSFPKTVIEGLDYLAQLSAMIDVDWESSSLRQEIEETVSELAFREREDVLPVFCPIWMDPLMTFDANAYASDVLSLIGCQNVFAGRPRRYPLAADLGLREAMTGSRVTGRDTRYPRITHDEVRANEPARILLPDEPHPFSTSDAAVLRELAVSVEPDPVRFVDGKALFWYGTRMARALNALDKAVR